MSQREIGNKDRERKGGRKLKMLYKCVRKQEGMGSTPAKTPAEIF